MKDNMKEHCVIVNNENKFYAGNGFFSANLQDASIYAIEVCIKNKEIIHSFLPIGHNNLIPPGDYYRLSRVELILK